MNRVLKNKELSITQRYGNGHTGIDIVGVGGTSDFVVAHSDGKIIFCQKGKGNNKGSIGNESYGNCIKIKHDNGYYTLYAHLDSTTLYNSQYVKKGQILGLMGNSGNSYGTHLHFEVFNENNQRINPERYLYSDLPNLNTSVSKVINNSKNYTGKITYQVYTSMWLNEVDKCDDTNEGYAGDKVNFISGVRAKPENGVLYINAHTLGGKWLGEISSDNYVKNSTFNGNSYAGIYGKKLDGIKIRSSVGYVDYRVLIKRNNKFEWLDWVSSTNSNEYAGIYGYTIYGIQMK